METIKIQCPNCGEFFEIDDSFFILGQTKEGQCPECKLSFKIKIDINFLPEE